MRKYLTRRCVGLHALVLVLVPAFLLAGWWQYRVALSGNDLSWVYTVEWPFFAVYAVYIWWRLIHDESTPFDRLWVAKQRAAADADGKPLHEIPGWATDKALAREVREASRRAARHPELCGPRPALLDNPDRIPARLMPALSDRSDELDPTSPCSTPIHSDKYTLEEPPGPVIDARVLGVKVNVNEELEAYNRYLFELSRNGPEKRWRSPKRARGDDAPAMDATSESIPNGRKPALPPTDEQR
jgi:hypothetical protein